MNLFRRNVPRAFCPILLVCFGLLSACGNSTTSRSSTPTGSSEVINVVAAENFYGDIVRQLGGSHVSVTSILSNPNVDPHVYASNVQTGVMVSKADLVVENSGGYDNWIDKLLSSSPNSNRLLVKGFDVATTRLPNNEHVWYSFNNAGVIAQAIAKDLKSLDPPDASTFDQNLQTFDQSLQSLQQKIATIKAKYNGTPVGLTETMYLYQTGPEGLNVLTPFEFEKAIAEGNTDPPADTVTMATDQITKHQIKILIYNVQTISQVTTNLENLAKSNNIPIVPVSETMPPKKTYQTWMMDQLNALQTALGG